MENLSKYVGNQIRKYREIRNMTQDELAELLKTTRQSISRYETGERKANQDILFDLADIFDVSINVFFPEPGDKTILVDKEKPLLSKIIKELRKLDREQQEDVYEFIQEKLSQNKKEE